MQIELLLKYVKYVSRAVENGRMDVHEASKNMLAVSDLIAVTAKVAYGEGAVATAQVIGFKKGSFETDRASQALPLDCSSTCNSVPQAHSFIWSLPALHSLQTAH